MILLSTICCIRAGNNIVKAPTQKSFTNSVHFYNIQHNQIDKQINKLVLDLRDDRYSKERKNDILFELQSKIDDKREITDKKRDLYKSYDLHWDEEFF